MKKLRISAEAERDLDSIWQFLFNESKNVDVGSRFVEEVVARLGVLEKSPKAGRLRSAIKPGLRALPIGKYLVYYHETKLLVVISRVIHGSRDQEKAFRDDRDQ